MKLFHNLSQAVVDALHEIFVEGRYADKVIEKLLKKNPKWGARDRRFIAETTYDIVRWYRLLSEISSAPEGDYWHLLGAWCVWNKIDLPTWPEFKGVDSRTFRSRFEAIENDRPIRESIPDWLDDLGTLELGDRWDDEIHALNEPARVVLRTNTLKTTRTELRKKLLDEDQIKTEAPANFPDALLLEERQNIFTRQAFKDGLFEVQDAGSQCIAPFLDVKPGMRVIDACAGAGGKTLHLASLLQNKGRIIAMDTESWKLEELKKRARRAGASNIEARTIESGKTIKRLERSADRLLLDVPCSGLGVIKRNPDAKWKLSGESIEKVKTLQKTILHDYTTMVKPGGVFVYATCSILPSENEEQVDAFLKENAGQFILLEQKTIYPSEGFDGFFMARIEKKK